mgnify:CR=1 FL=1
MFGRIPSMNSGLELSPTSKEPVGFDFTAKQHFELGEALRQMDFDAAARMAGARFVVLSGELARLERALATFMLDIHIDRPIPHMHTKASRETKLRNRIRLARIGTGETRLLAIKDDAVFGRLIDQIQLYRPQAQVQPLLNSRINCQAEIGESNGGVCDAGHIINHLLMDDIGLIPEPNSRVHKYVVDRLYF